MRIKTVKISGFKSFLDPTVLNFENPLSVIVGPNGCGKSNIVDSIKWVMGEQSSKTLRCDSMSDVIFNGSKTKKPVGMAEVSVIFENVSENKDLLKYLQENELTIKRRVYRSGESEYFINKTPVRLKDIHSILLDIKLGVNSYSIIEQDQLSSLINAKPIERRVVIEEACGITKYKKHKKEALSKITATTTNLERIKDIFNEVAKAKANLAIHSQKAGLYRKYKEKHDELEKALVAINFINDSKKLNDIENVIKELTDKEESLNTNVNSNEARISEQMLAKEEGNTSLEEKEKEVNSLKEIVFGKNNNVSLLKKDLEGLENRKVENNEFVQKLENDFVYINERKNTISDDYSKVSDDISNLEQENAGLKIKFEDMGKNHAEMKDTLIKEEKNKLEILRHLGERNSKIGIYDAKISEIRSNAGRLTDEKIDLNNVISKANDKIKEITSELTTKKNEVARLETEYNLFQEKIKSRKEMIAEYEDNRGNVSDNFSMKQSRLTVLKEMEDSFGGYSEAAKYILKSPDFNFSSISNIISMSQHLESAVAAVLSERIDSIVTDNVDIACDLSEILWDKTLGRASFVPTNIKHEESKRTKFKSDRVLGYLVDLVEYEDKYQNIVNFLFGNIVVVDDIREAKRLWEIGDNQCEFVTLRGEYLGSFGTLSCGSFDVSKTDVLSRKRVISEIEEDKGKLGVIKDLVMLKANELKGELLSYKEELERLEEQMGSVEKDIIFGESELEQQKIRISNEEDTLSYVDIKLGSNKNEEAKIEEEKQKLVQELNLYKEKEKQNAIYLACLTAEKNNIGLELGNISDGLTEYRIKSSNFEIIKSEALKNKEDLAKQRERLEKQKLEKKCELDEIALEIDKKVNEIENEKKVLEEKTAQYNTISTEFENLKLEYKAKEKELQDLRGEVENDQKELLRIAGRKNRRDVAKKEFEIKVENAKKMILEKHKIDVVNISIPEEFNIEESKKEKDRYANFIERLGEVNFTAAKEYDEVSERFNFLKSQKADLEKALQSLNLTINKINKTCRDLFFEAFNEVAKNFEIVTKQLFKHGRGELILTNPEDLLESGVDIFVQPQGKKVKNINILSGGEKALVLIAYLISVFYYKPSPFCILDEIDAPLDDANIEKFTNMIREMSARTQFIIVTHNKQTMNVGDVLYGVTMEEAGVSKIVEARFSDIEEKAA